MRNSTFALILSCALHAAVFLSFTATPPSGVARPQAPKSVEIELRQVEARRGPPAVENKKRASKRPPAARTSVPVPVTPVVDEGAPVAPSGPPSDEPGGEEPGGSGEGESGAALPPPPPRPDTRAEVLTLPRIEYPIEAREEGVDGVVRLWVVVDATGRVINVEIRDDPGFGLGEAARRAMLSATFRPATHLGANVGSSFEYLYRFELE